MARRERISAGSRAATPPSAQKRHSLVLKRPAQRPRVDASRRDLKQLWGAAAGRCSFPKCGAELIAPPAGSDDRVVLGEHAHIIPHSDGGPRAADAAAGFARRHTYENLILLCEKHHKIVDGQPSVHTADALRRYKRDHEARCATPFAPMPGAPEVEELARANVAERLHSTLFAVTRMPRTVFSAATTETRGRALKEKHRAAHGRSPPAFVLRRGRLYTFLDLSEKDNPFAAYIEASTVTHEYSHELWRDADRLGEFIALLNALLLKIGGARGLTYDPEHSRWYFGPGADGTELSIDYTPPNKKTSRRKVAWRPLVKSTGEPRNYWQHLAVSLAFHLVGDRQWVFSIRPERYFTRDGVTPLSRRNAGRRTTSTASRLYNGEVLEDVLLWRSFLSGDRSRIIKNVGTDDKLIIDTRMLDVDVSWPGVPDDSRPFRNIELAADEAWENELQALESDDEFEFRLQEES